MHKTNAALFSRVALVVAVLTTPALGEGVDLTLQAFAGGCEVIEAVIGKLHRSQAFPTDTLNEYGMLQDIAYAETEAQGGPRGPWGVTDHMLAITQNTTAQTNSVAHLIANVENSTVLRTANGSQIVWSEVSTADLSKPLYSAIAAHLFFKQASGTNRLFLEAGWRAALWRVFYRHAPPGVAIIRFFMTRVAKLRAECGTYAGM